MRSICFNPVRTVLTALLVVAIYSTAWSADPPSAAEAELRQASQAYIGALEKGDYVAAAEFWTKDGAYVDSAGKSVAARERLAQAASAKRAPRLVQVGPVKVRFLTPDVAIEEGTFDYRDAATGNIQSARFTAIWVRHNKLWRLDNLREAAAEDAVDPAPLAGLDVLTGDWSGQHDKLSARLSARWNESKKYLICEYTLTADGKPVFHGEQRLVWDPLSKSIRSFSVNDDGGFGTGRWSREGTLWMVTSQRVLPDGKTASSTQTFRFRDRDTLEWKVIRSTVEGQSLPDMEFELARGKGAKP